MYKQVIVVRKDLNMRKGKIAAQASHACMKVFFDKMSFFSDSDREENTQSFICRFTPAMLAWLNWQDGQPGFTKIVVSCDSEEALYSIEAAAKAANLPHALIKDNGVTEFHGVQTPTCICIGPAEAELIDPITGKYPLL